MRMRASIGGMVLAVLTLAGCADPADPVAGMHAWIQAQKPGPARTLEPWPELAAGGESGRGEMGRPADEIGRDPFAAAPVMGAASDAAASGAASAGPVYLGLLRRGSETAAVVRQGDAVELVRVGQRVGRSGARVSGIDAQALTLRLEGRGSTGPDGEQRLQRLPLAQEGTR